MSTIGLFPLNLVIFPGSSYPIHIFEERYKQLIGDSIESGDSFGINLVETGKMFQVGCLVTVTSVLRTLPDGRRDIVVTGSDRYRIEAYRSGVKSYLVADVEPFVDEDPRPTWELLESTVALYNQLMEAAYSEEEEILDPTDWIAGGAAFRIAQKAGLELATRQQLLEMRSETERLRLLETFLKELVPKVKEAERLQALIRNDGYVK